MAGLEERQMAARDLGAARQFFLRPALSFTNLAYRRQWSVGRHPQRVYSAAGLKCRPRWRPHSILSGLALLLPSRSAHWRESDGNHGGMDGWVACPPSLSRGQGLTATAAGRGTAPRLLPLTHLLPPDLLWLLRLMPEVLLDLLAR